MNPANLITGLRFVLVPLIFAAIWRYNATYPVGGEMWRFVAVWAFAVAILTDFLDGYVARRFNCATKIGALIDPLADKVQCVLAIIALSLARRSFEPVKVWYPALIVTKEIITGVLAFAIRRKIPSSGFKPLIIGKVSVWFQAGAIMWLLLKWAKGYVVYTISGFVAAIVIITYIYLWISYMKGRKNNWEPLAEVKE